MGTNIEKPAVWKPPPLRCTVMDFQRGSPAWSDDTCIMSDTTDDTAHLDMDSLLDLEEAGESDADIDCFELAEF